MWPDDDNNLIYIEKQPLHPRDGLRRQTKKDHDIDNDELIYIDKRHLHLHDRLRCQIKKDKDNNILFFKKRPQHPCDRLEQKTKKLEFDTEILTEVSFINTYILLDKKESLSSEKKIGHIIRNLPGGNNRYYIEHEEGSNTFKILEDPQIKEKNKQIY